MRASKNWLATIFAILLPSITLAQPPHQGTAGTGSSSTSVSPAAGAESKDKGESSQPSDNQPTALDRVMDKIIEKEHDQVLLFVQYRPVIETYIQDTRPDTEMGIVPFRDFYLLGQADLSTGVVDRSMLRGKPGLQGLWESTVGSANGGYQPQGFLEMIYVDRKHFDKQHYKFQYQRRAFLGEVRCLVFDLAPLPVRGNGGFMGRIWVEDQNYTIVRFNGLYLATSWHNQKFAHFDSWRMNVHPGLWLPSCIFTQETGKDPHVDRNLHFKAQTRFWGYDLKTVGHEAEFSDLTIESPTPIQDDSAQQEHDRLPVQAERAWQREAEDNAIDTMQRTGLVAPPGPVDKVLDTVLNNLIVTNNINLDPEPRQSGDVFHRPHHRAEPRAARCPARRVNPRGNAGTATRRLDGAQARNR
jgi:hypothetical protein